MRLPGPSALSTDDHISLAEDYLSDSKDNNSVEWRMLAALQAIAHADIAALKLIRAEIEADK